MRYRPCVPDNVKQSKVFEDEIEIKRFLELIDEFSNSLIDEDEDEEDGQVDEFAEDEIAGHKIIELKSNFIPKGLVPLERIFTKDDTPSKPVVQSSEENVIDCNIGQLNILEWSKFLNH